MACDPAVPVNALADVIHLSVMPWFEATLSNDIK